MNLTNIPLEEKTNVLRLVFGWLDKVAPGREFGPRELQKFVRQQTDGKRNPQDGTITRYIRAYNAQGGRIKNVSRSKSIYRKELEWEQGVLGVFEQEQKGARA
ncbi:MAG: hypothetical protein VB088_08035 [Sphaerochaeta sp.]|jgi:hypothetical protein|nr:hypothetical protein [Sphaerochaeta sp.]